MVASTQAVLAMLCSHVGRPCAWLLPPTPSTLHQTTQPSCRPPPDRTAQEAIDTCPVSCIHWVTAPQLTLLEETMGRMERVAAWLLVRGRGRERLAAQLPLVGRDVQKECSSWLGLQHS